MSATAWRLFSASASGGKYYDILLVDRFVLVGWGSMTGTMQYKIEKHHSANNARAWAVEQTSAKEKKGYWLAGTVHVAPGSPQDYIDVLDARGGHRGSSIAFDHWFSQIFDEGVKLS